MTICQIAQQLVELLGAIHKVGVIDDFAKHERVLSNHYAKQRNAK